MPWLDALMPTGFLLLRPLWLLALLPLPWLLWRLSKQTAGAGRWQDIIDDHLLRVLLQQDQHGTRRRWPLVVMTIAWLLATLALAGPSFRSQDTPVFQRDSARVYVLDLSPSMNADDVKPSRLARARLKLLDALNQRRDGEQALMVYAGSAHVLTPLATDAKTLAAQVPVLTTALPPVRGNRPELALQRAVQLLKDAGHNGGEIVWLTDGIDADQVDRVTKVLKGQAIRLAVLAIGTAAGAPIRQDNGALLSDKAGNVILARLDLAPLQAVVAEVQGRLATLQADDSDWQALQFPQASLEGKARRIDGELQLREDAGAWLVLPLLVLTLLAFRRGSLLPVCLLALTSFSPRSEAGWWQDLWQTPDQQAAQQLKGGDANAAAQTFRDPDWQATAQYRAGDYAAAAQRFSGANATSQFNQANALAKAGKLAEAIASYDKALKQKPDFTAARENRDAVAQQKQQQEQKQQRQDQQQRDQQQQSQEQDQQGRSADNQANAEQGNADSQPSPQQNSAQQNSGQEKEPQAADNGNEQDAQPSTPATQKDAGADPKHAQQNQQQAPAQSQQQKQTGQKDGGRTTTTKADEEEQALPANATPLPAVLQQLPDDPGGLLRRKMKLEYLRRGQETQQQDQEQRW